MIFKPLQTSNEVTLNYLWKAGFDAVIVNPIMGQLALKKLVLSAHKKHKGVITLCHMSAPEAKASYEMKIQLNSSKTIPLYQLFLKSALSNKVDGIIVGATYPETIKFCHKKSKENLNIYSPGIGTQGGKIAEVLNAGSDFLIIGRTILNDKNPAHLAEKLQKLSFLK